MEEIKQELKRLDKVVEIYYKLGLNYLIHDVQLSIEFLEDLKNRIKYK